MIDSYCANISYVRTYRALLLRDGALLLRDGALLLPVAGLVGRAPPVACAPRCVREHVVFINTYIYVYVMFLSAYIYKYVICLVYWGRRSSEFVLDEECVCV